MSGSSSRLQLDQLLLCGELISEEIVGESAAKPRLVPALVVFPHTFRVLVSNSFSVEEAAGSTFVTDACLLRRTGYDHRQTGNERQQHLDCAAPTISVAEPREGAPVVAGSRLVPTCVGTIAAIHT